MLWLLMLCVSVRVSVAYEVQCDPPQCVAKNQDWDWHYYTVEGHEISITYPEKNKMSSFRGFYLNCGGWAALDSAAMLRFTSEVRVSEIELSDCPMPAHRSLVEALAALNVTFQPKNNNLDLQLTGQPSTPTISSHHFSDLESLTYLAIIAPYNDGDIISVEPASGFLSGLTNLKSLVLSGVKIATNELRNLPRSIDWFQFTEQNMVTVNTYSETLRALPNLQNLTIERRPYADDILWKTKYEHREYLEGRKHESLPLEKVLQLYGWEDKNVAPFEQCGELQSIKLQNPSFVELPERWVANCVHLEDLHVLEAKDLKSLPANLLEGATALKRLSIQGQLTSLPDGWLQSVPNLLELNLDHNKLKTLSSGWFSGPALQYLSLKSNELDNSAVTVLASQTSLTKLFLNYNHFSGYVCQDEGGVWSLRNLSISVPRAVLSGEGEAVVLRCSYDLEGAALYSIKWYRAETEFYRYVPREMPPSLVFPLPGTLVDLTQSDHQQVRIVNMHRQLSGEYQCEVSADAPLFHTDIESAPFTVVDPPFRAPQISISRSSYARGDTLRANCSVDDAYPAPNITWILDEHKIAETISWRSADTDFKERPAFSQIELTILEAEHYKMGLTSTSSLLHRVYQDHYVYRDLDKEEEKEVLRYTLAPPPTGQFTLTCVATIFDIYARKSEPVFIKEDAPHPASVTGEDSSGSSRVCSFILTFTCAYAALL